MRTPHQSKRSLKNLSDLFRDYHEIQPDARKARLQQASSIIDQLCGRGNDEPEKQVDESPGQQMEDAPDELPVSEVPEPETEPVEVGQDAVEGLQDQLLQRLQTAWVAHGVGNS